MGNINFADLEGSYINKITSVRDIDAEPVEFMPSATMDIFLMPALQNSQGVTVYYDGLHTSGPQSDFIKRADHLNYIRSVFNRDLWGQFLELTETEDLTSYQSAYRLWQILKQFAHARARRLTTDFSEIPPYPYSTVMETVSPGAFPYSPIYTNTPEPSAPDPFTNSLSVGVYMTNDLFVLQQLKFIIRQNNQTYYFWYLEE